MRLIQADCTIDYKGRGESHLELGLRLILIKSDKSVSIHQDKGIKPMNYISNAKIINESTNSNGIPYIYAEKNNENILITMYKIYNDMNMTLESKSKLKQLNTEKDL